MTGQEIQDRVDALVMDLQTSGKGQSVSIVLRGDDNTPTNFNLSSDIAGNVDAGQLDALQDFIDTLKPVADEYALQFEPVRTASEAFRAAREAHQALIDAASAAREALSAALEADRIYQDAKMAYDAAREDPQYIAARDAYKNLNVSENFGNLQEAKGKYVS